jgi:hypothetical protein
LLVLCHRLRVNANPSAGDATAQPACDSCPPSATMAKVKTEGVAARRRAARAAGKLANPSETAGEATPSKGGVTKATKEEAVKVVDSKKDAKSAVGAPKKAKALKVDAKDVVASSEASKPAVPKTKKVFADAAPVRVDRTKEAAMAKAAKAAAEEAAEAAAAEGAGEGASKDAPSSADAKPKTWPRKPKADAPVADATPEVKKHGHPAKVKGPVSKEGPNTADAKAAKKRLIGSVTAALAGGWKLGEAFRDRFLQTQDYQSVRGALCPNPNP